VAKTEGINMKAEIIPDCLATIINVSKLHLSVVRDHENKKTK
jgi:hypothetical protein